MTAIRWVISLLFVINIYVMMLIMGILFLPWAAASPNGARVACATYARYTLWCARWMVGIRSEVRGTVPQGEVLVAAKHQSFLDIIMIYNALPAAKFIMKNELLYTPVIGVYAYRLGCIPVKRGRRAEAIKKMVADVKAGDALPGQLCIYPQGTRIKPGVKAPYKIGTYALYRELNQPCVPVATNAGVFWPRKGIMRKPGLAVVDFLDPIETGIDQDAFMKDMEERIETRSEALLDEAGFQR